MNDRKTELFLDTYRKLEAAAERVVGNSSRSSSILRLAHMPEFARYREELDYCRQVRNLLTHEAKIGGAYGVEPSDQLLAVLQKVLRQLEDPPTLGEYMTPVSRLITAKPNQTVYPLLTAMNQQGVSFVPILEKNVVVGVFSLRVLLRFLLEGGQLTQQLTFEEMASHLSLQQQTGIRFVSPRLPLEQGRELFRWVNAKHQRVKLLLVTQNGQPSGPLLGIVSPYDILKEE